MSARAGRIRLHQPTPSTGRDLPAGSAMARQALAPVETPAAHARWLLGHDADARSSCLEAIRLARAVDHPYSLAVALAYGSIPHQMRHDTSELRDTVGELRDLCDRYGFAYYREWGLVLDGWS